MVPSSQRSVEPMEYREGGENIGSDSQKIASHGSRLERAEWEKGRLYEWSQVPGTQD